MTHLEFNLAAKKLIDDLTGQLEALHDSGDVGRAVFDQLEQLKRFQVEHQPYIDVPVREMQEASDQYACIAISTNALTEADKGRLSIIAGNGMVFERSTGFFIKLYEETEYVLDMLGSLPGGVHNIDKLLLNAHKAGYRMVEFDCDAELYREVGESERD